MRSRFFLSGLFVLLSLLGSVCPLQSQETAWQGESVESGAAEVVYREYHVLRASSARSSGPDYRVSNTPRQTRIFTYDRSGRVLSRVALGASGEEQVRWEMTYDTAGRLVTESQLEGKKVSFKRIYRYGPNNLLQSVEAAYTATPKDVTRTVFTYDAAGHTVEERRSDSAGKVFFQIRRKYGKDELLEEETKDQTLITKSVWTSDGYYRFETLERRNDGVLIDRAVIRHLPDGFKVGMDVYDASGGLTAEVDYVQNDRRTTELYRSGDGGTRYSEVDELNNPVSEGYDERGTDYLYEFDESENWVRQTAWPTYEGRRGSTPSTVILRQIRYYP